MHGPRSRAVLPAVASRDPRFDGWFVGAVRTTGIYCRPSCPAVTPKRQHRVLPDGGGRPRARLPGVQAVPPDASPGSPEWNVRGDVVARAMRLIADGVVDREGVTGLARRLRYSERHLNRLLTDELGAGPLAIARAQRATTARVLIETSTDAVHVDRLRRRLRQRPPVQRHRAGRVRVRRRTAWSAPDRRRRARANAGAGRASTSPCASRSTRSRRWRSSPARAIPASSTSTATRTTDARAAQRARRRHRGRRTVVRGDVARPTCASPTGATSARPCGAFAGCSTSTPIRWRSTPPLGADPALAALVAAVARLRVPGSVDPFETAVRAVVGQQVSVAGARTVAARHRRRGRCAAALADDQLTHVFPSPAELAADRPGAAADAVRRGAHARRSGRPGRPRQDRARRRRRPRRGRRGAARRAGHRAVDRRLRADARARRSRRVPRRPTSGVAIRPRPTRHRRRVAERVAAVALVRPSTTCGPKGPRP